VAKIVSVILTVFFCLSFGMLDSSYAGRRDYAPKTEEEKARIMKEHMEKVKMKNPAKYDVMIKNAGGPVTKCIDCHTEVEVKKKKP